jgi:hypothetical protein
MKHSLRQLFIAALVLFCAGQTHAQTTNTTLVASGEPWKYYDKSATPPAQGSNTWFSTALDDTTYSIATTIGFGPDPNAKYATTYFRKTIIVSDISTYSGYTLRYKKDDAIVIYVNGIEIKRENITTGTVSFSTLATANIADATNNTYVTVRLPNGAIQPGNNVIAAEVHQVNETSSDLFFDLDLVATANQNTLTAISLPVVSTTASAWKVQDNGTDQGTGWTAAAFNDSFWRQVSPATGKFDGSANGCYYFKDRHATTNEGTIYVVNGHGGASGGNQGTAGGWPLGFMQTSYDQSSGGSMYIEIEGGVLTVKMIAGSDGSVQDQFTIIKDTDTFNTPATDNTARAANCECTDAAGLTHYTDNGLNRLLAVRKNGQNIGRVGDGTLTMNQQGASGASFVAKNTPTNYVSNPAGWWLMNRHWTLNPTPVCIFCRRDAGRSKPCFGSCGSKRAVSGSH